MYGFGDYGLAAEEYAHERSLEERCLSCGSRFFSHSLVCSGCGNFPGPIESVEYHRAKRARKGTGGTYPVAFYQGHHP